MIQNQQQMKIQAFFAVSIPSLPRTKSRVRSNECYHVRFGLCGGISWKSRFHKLASCKNAHAFLQLVNMYRSRLVSCMHDARFGTNECDWFTSSYMRFVELRPFLLQFNWVFTSMSKALICACSIFCNAQMASASVFTIHSLLSLG